MFAHAVARVVPLVSPAAQSGEFLNAYVGAGHNVTVLSQEVKVLRDARTKSGAENVAPL
jgi:hypothetical protein